MTGMEIIGVISAAFTIGGVSAKDLKQRVSNSDKQVLDDYFSFLETRKVLTEPFNNEVTLAVIKSLESIKVESEKFKVKLKSKEAQHIVLDLIYTLSSELMYLYKHQGKDDELHFYKSLQRIRVRFAKVLCVLCSAYKIDLSTKQTELAKLVLEHGYRPR